MGCYRSSNYRKSGSSTKGNPFTHVILRGSDNGPNYHPSDIINVVNQLKCECINESIIIDCSHGNYQKNHKNQLIVLDSVCKQIQGGNTNIRGIMLESNLVEGNQSIEDRPLIYGKSITDSCIDLQDTLECFIKISKTISKNRYPDL